MSTALGRALNEGDESSVYINEPFNRNNDELDYAASTILKAVDQAAANVAIVKNMASYLNRPNFKALDGFSKATLWSVRDPLLQMGSLLTRLVNDRFGSPGQDLIPQESVYPYLGEIEDFLISSSKSTNFQKLAGRPSMAISLIALYLIKQYPMGRN